jgi:phosphatidate cytidylyltransferase
MAFNWETFTTRSLSAVGFVIVMLAGLFMSQWSFLLLFSVIHFGCWWEYWKLIEKIYNTAFHAFTKVGLMVMGYGLMLWFCGSEYAISGYGIKANFSLPVSIAGFVVLLVGIFQKNAIVPKAFGMALLGLFYISLSWGLMMDLYGIETGNVMMYKESRAYLIYFPLVIIGCMWVNDTMAYIVGSLIGKTPFSKISPKKTWEGTIGGIILASLIIGFFAFIPDEWFVFGQTFKWWATLAFIAAVAGTLGDLLESKIKRMAGVKDSGNLLPGHGGFLDRFDSLLLAIPFAWLFVTLFLG